MAVLATSSLLATTLALTLVSFLATLFVILRTLVPLIGPHVLSRYSRPHSPLPVFGYGPQQGEKVKLKSAQRFHCWLAIIDITSSGIWLWEVIAVTAGSPTSPARMAFAICSRPTVLLVVSLLSYLNIVRGKVVNLGRFDVIVWMPSLILMATAVSLAYVASPADKAVWEVMTATVSALLLVCSFCFGRLLLAVFRVRQDTIKSQMLRHRATIEEKAYATATLQAHQCEDADDGGGRRRTADEPPLLPPVKTNRWNISKTFLLGKASSAANTVSASLHRRSASGPQGPRPSTNSERFPRPSASSASDQQHSDQPNSPYAFLAHDPAATSRSTHFRASSNSQAEPHPAPITPRSITFDIDAASPPPDNRPGALSRLTNATHQSLRVSIDEPRPSMGSYISAAESNSTDSHGVSAFLSAQRLSNNHGHRNNGRAVGLSRREARRAGAGMGGHLVGCVVSWICVLPFLAHKIERPASPVPLYCSILVALGISLSGPLLALQTVLAYGFWRRKESPPLMASSSAAAFEHLESRAGTPFPFSPTANHSPVTATGPQREAAPTDNTARSHRSTPSSSSSSLVSLAAFSAPPPGVVRNSLDTADAPSKFARVVAMASPHPKLQRLGRRADGGPGRESRDLEALGMAGEDETWQKKESRKLKSFSLTRKRSSTVTSLGRSRDDAEKALTTPRTRRSILDSKDSNALTLQMLAESDRKAPSPTPSIQSRRFSSSRKGHHRHSMPVRPVSTSGVTEHGVAAKRKTVDIANDPFTRSLLASLVPGLKTTEGICEPLDVGAKGAGSSVKRRPPQLHLSEARGLASGVEREKAQGHLRRRSVAAAESSGNDGPGRLDDIHVTRRPTVQKRLSPAIEASSAKEDEYECQLSPSAPRPSLEEEDEDETPLEDSRLEVLSESELQSPVLLSPTTPAGVPDSPFPYLAVPEGEERATVSKAYRAPKVLSRRSSFSSEIMLRPSSRLSSASSANTSGHTASVSMGSVTSRGFENMISSNRTSWTAPEGDTQILRQVSSILSLRNANAQTGQAKTCSSDKEKEKDKKAEEALPSASPRVRGSSATGGHNTPAYGRAAGSIRLIR